MSGKASYTEYLQSKEWREISQYIRLLADHKCKLCDNELLEIVLEVDWLISDEAKNIPEVELVNEYIIKAIMTKTKMKSPSAFLHTHHKTYTRLGKEKESDLTALCLICHGLIHDYDQERAKDIVESILGHPVNYH